MIVFGWTLIFWISGLLLTIIWLVPALQLALHSSDVTDLTRPEWNLRRIQRCHRLPSLFGTQ